MTGGSGNCDRSGKNWLLTHLNNWSGGGLDRSGSGNRSGRGNGSGSGNRSGIKEVGVHFDHTDRLGNGPGDGLNKGLGSEAQSGNRSGHKSGSGGKRSGSNYSVTEKLPITALSFPHYQPLPAVA